MTRTSSSLVSDASLGSKIFTFDVAFTNTGWVLGSRVRASLGSQSNYFLEGVVTDLTNTRCTLNIDYVVGPVAGQSSWNMGIAGDRGAQGTSGGAGTQGSQGPQGVQGSAGSSGAQGNQGVQGAAGSQGSQGSQGASGASGAQGNQGTQGSVGSQGTQGHQGFQGVQGATGTGTQGNQGPQGFQGVQGSVGAQGNQGTQGTQGQASSVAGPQGNQGNVGGTGSQGSQGNQGNSGSQGSQGFQGNQGPQGFQGNQGNPSNVAGPQGNQGYQGSQGATGSGSQGAQGAKSQETATSSSSVPDGLTGSKTFVFDQAFTNCGWQVGTRIRASLGAQINSYLEGPILTLSGTQCTLMVDNARSVVGGQSGWNLSIAGDVGSQGGAGSQGNQGAQGYQGAQGSPGSGNLTIYSVQGNQVQAAAQTVVDIFAGISVSGSTQYEYYAVIGAQPNAGTQGAQFGIQCSIGGATVMGVVHGPQTTTGDRSYMQTAQGNGTNPVQCVAGIQAVVLSGIITTPAGSPTLGVQMKGVQASQVWWAKANSYIVLTKTS